MVFKRIRDLAVATINEGLDQLENPVVMLNQYLRDMEKEIRSAEEAITKQLTIKTSFEKQKSEVSQLLQKREQQAELALRAGEEDLARRAIFSKQQYETKVNQYEEFINQNNERIQELKTQLSQLKEKYRDMKDKKAVLIARANAAQTKNNMDQAMTRLNHERADLGFQRMEEKIIELETRVKINAAAGDPLLYNNLENLESKEIVENELQRLREKIQQNNAL